MSVSVEVVDQVGLGLSLQAVTDLLSAVLEAEKASGTITVAVVDEQAIEELNARYRGPAEPTDVLSFRYADDPEAWAAQPDAELGELIVCPAVVRRYAEEDQVPERTQLGWTLVHGALHLLGYDHERDRGEMREHEQELLNLFRPLVDRLPELGGRLRTSGENLL